MACLDGVHSKRLNLSVAHIGGDHAWGKDR